ncbi:MAG TPA: S41 family peptidase [Candidatus Limnocylindria bacterium]|nr:S41 family peptidase [Candidatus Limnocylindria bacterium]
MQSLSKTLSVPASGAKDSSTMAVRGIIGGILLLGGVTLGAAPDLHPLPPLDDLVRVLRTNLVISPADFDSEAGHALVEHFGGQVLGPGEAGEVLSDAPALAKKSTLEGGCLYVRIGQISPALAPQLTAAVADTNWLNGARGLILDLRFTGGSAFRAAAESAALFVPPNHKLLDWGEESFLPIGATTTDWKLPIAVLVNRQTSGAAEALAGILRAESAAIIIGGTTAGRASLYRDIELADGAKLHLPVAAAKTSDGNPIPRTGLKPDIAVKVTLEQERAYLADPFITVLAGTNAPSGTNVVTATVTVRKRLNEAELVRSRREETNSGGVSDKADTTKAESKIVRDPVLARAVDMLKGLAVLNRK